MDKKEFLNRVKWFENSEKVEDKIKKDIFNWVHQYIPSSYPPYQFSGFLPVRVGRFHAIEIPRYVAPGVYPIYSYIPSLYIASILVFPQNVNLPTEHQISIPENWFYEIEIILDINTFTILERQFRDYRLNIIFVYPIEGSGFDYPPIRPSYVSIFNDLYLYFCLNCEENLKYAWYILKPFVIFPALQALRSVFWENPYKQL
jgi:hypothetical protein